MGTLLSLYNPFLLPCAIDRMFVPLPPNSYAENLMPIGVVFAGVALKGQPPTHTYSSNRSRKFTCILLTCINGIFTLQNKDIEYYFPKDFYGIIY